MKKKKHKRMTIRLTKQEVRIMMEQRLRSRKIPSKKIYNRKKNRP